MRILVIEDELRIANSIKKGLEQEFFAVDVAGDGPSGYDLAAIEDYDLIILDLMLPGLSGKEICAMLRNKNIQTPILVLTARDLVGDKVEALNTGADDYLTKPFSFDELVARVKALTRRPVRSLNPTLKVEDLTLNTSTLEVKRSGKTIDLSGKEFAILENLMRQPGKVVPKQKIINHVWDYESNILPNTVEAHIKNLRRKIDFPFKGRKRLIQTVRGFGYKIG